MAHQPADGEPRAIDAPGVAASLRRYRRHALLTVGVGVALIIACGVIATVMSDREDRLVRDGVRAVGTIVDTDSSGIITPGSVQVQFDYGGVSRTEEVRLNDNSPDYEIGQTVTVIVDPNDPQHMTIAGESNDSLVFVFAFIVSLVCGALALPCGIVLLVRVRRMRKVLSDGTWTEAAIEYREVRHLRSRYVLVQLNLEPAVRLLVLASTTWIRLRRAGLREATVIEVAGDPRHRVALRTPGDTTLVWAYAPRSDRSARRWQERFDESSPI